MENASNALIMAAGVLIGILILSLAVYLFIDFGSTASEINSQITEQQISQDNLSEYKIIIYLGTQQIQDNINNKKIELIQNDKNLINASNLNLPTYECKVLSYYGSGRIHEIKFTKKTP